jgi:hypothetical protein
LGAKGAVVTLVNGIFGMKMSGNGMEWCCSYRSGGKSKLLEANENFENTDSLKEHDVPDVPACTWNFPIIGKKADVHAGLLR